MQWSTKFKHLANVEHAVQNSDMDWTLIRPGLLLEEGSISLDKPLVMEDAFFVGSGAGITRKALADFVVEAAVNGKYVKKAVAIGGT